jgi:hypothetical protein
VVAHEAKAQENHAQIKTRPTREETDWHGIAVISRRQTGSELDPLTGHPILQPYPAI